MSIVCSPTLNAQRVRSELDVVYGEADGQKLLLDVFLPKTDSPAPRPAMIFIHGGAWSVGSKLEFRGAAQAAASLGYVSFCVNYRLLTPDGRNRWPAQLDDAQRAVRWARSHADKYNLDPRRIAAIGHSAGGHLAAFLGTRDTRDNSDPALAAHSSRVTCVVSMGGPVDLETVIREQSTDLIDLLRNFLGGGPADWPARARDASPLFFVDAGSAPTLVIHGERDEVVDVKQGVAFHEALRKAGVESQILLFPDEKHVISKKENLDLMYQKIMTFMTVQLPPSPIPDAAPNKAAAISPPSQTDWTSNGIAERARLLREMRALIADRRDAAQKTREKFFRPDMASPDAYEASLAPLRTELFRLLGWPLWSPDTDAVADAWSTPAQGSADFLHEDDLGPIYRIRADVVGGLQSSGLLFLPKTATGPFGEGKSYPLVIAQHGGIGSPELAAGLTKAGPVNYNAMITGLRRHHVAVYAPQLPVWHQGLEPKMDQYEIDHDLRQLGGSRAALDLLMLKKSLDWLLASRPEIDPGRIGMAGLSYGGFYTLLFSALDTRIRVAVSSCYFNDGYSFARSDMIWQGSALKFLDVELARMICPRPLFIEGGERDTIRGPRDFSPLMKEIATTYAGLGRAEVFQSRLHPGGHEYDPDGKAGAFLLKNLGVLD